MSIRRSTIGKALVVGLILAFAAVGIRLLLSGGSEVKQGEAQLRRAYKLRRPVHARLTSLSYAPYSETRGAAVPPSDPEALRLAELRLLDAETSESSPESLHALGVFYLSQSKFGDAIRCLTQALNARSNDTLWESDLASALLEKGKSDKRGSDPDKGSAADNWLEELSEALEHIERALKTDPRLPEALFNRALCFQEMLLLDGALHCWSQYLEYDRSSPWAQEARRNLERLEDEKSSLRKTSDEIIPSFLKAYNATDADQAWRFISTTRDGNGSAIENTLVDRYLEAAASNRHSAESASGLAVLSFAAGLEVDRANDHFLERLVQFYKSISAEDRDKAAGARKLAKQGVAFFHNSQIEAARQSLRQAQKIFTGLGDECDGLYLQYPLGHCYLIEGKYELGRSNFASLAKASEAGGYQWLLALALAGRANAEIGLNMYSDSVSDLQRALALCEKTGDANGVIRFVSQLGDAQLFLNNYHEAVRRYQQASVLESGKPAESYEHWRTCFMSGLSLFELGLCHAALGFENEALNSAMALQDPELLCRTYVDIGLIYEGAHDYPRAIENVQVALDRASKIDSLAARSDLTAYSSLQLGNLFRRAGQSNNALLSYDQAISIYDKAELKAFSYAAHKGKLLALNSIGTDQTIADELKVTLNLFEGYRSKIEGESSKDIFFDAEQNVYDIAIDYAYNREKDDQRAFNYSEQCRARSLLGLIDSAGGGKGVGDKSAAQQSAPVSVADLRRRMAEGIQIVQYAVLQNRLIIWAVSRDGFSSAERDMDYRVLEKQVKDYLNLVSSPSSDAEEVSARGAGLYNLLITPVETFLDENKPLCVIPDKVLSLLPYETLCSPSSNRYLLEDHTIFYAPSSSVFLACSAEARNRAVAGNERILSIGDPAFSTKAYPGLGRLSSAAEEARHVAELYESAQVYVGDQATKSTIQRKIGKAEVVEIAAHTITDEYLPDQSRILFAPDGPSAGSDDPLGDGALRAGEIYKMRFPATRLVVLSSCRSGVERYYGGEGMIGVARPFISGGVPLVVASLWPTETQATARLIIGFHTHRKRDGISTIAALRQAKLDLIHGSDAELHRPYYWAAFIAVGGDAEF